jgi:hypothetical protein
MHELLDVFLVKLDRLGLRVLLGDQRSLGLRLWLALLLEKVGDRDHA